MTLSLSNIHYCFDTQPVLQQISFDVKPGELLCLAGPSGCGKSTLLRLIAGLTPLQSGEIMLDGRLLASDTTHLPVQQRHIGMVFQHPSLFPHLTVEQNIAFGIGQHTKEHIQSTITELLSLIGLEGYEQHYPHMLSGGQQQRVALARSLAPKPKLMLLDEPFANLDYHLRRDIAKDIITILKSANIPIIMVTHDPEEVLLMADQVALLSKKGQIQQYGSPQTLYYEPNNPETASFFGPINHITGAIRGDLITSPFGNLPKKDHLPDACDGENVTIITRPEGLCASKSQDPASIEIIEQQHIGAGWLLSGQYDDDNKVVQFYHHGFDTPQIGDTISLTFQPPHVSVFPI